MMKKKIIIICVAGIFFVGFHIYSIWPCNDEHVRAYIDYLRNEGLLMENNVLYAVELELNSETITTIFHSQDYFGSLKECAIQAIKNAAERDGIELPTGFENEIVIEKVLGNVEKLS